MEEWELRHKCSHQGCKSPTANAMTTPFPRNYLHIGKVGAVTVAAAHGEFSSFNPIQIPPVWITSWVLVRLWLQGNPDQPFSAEPADKPRSGSCSQHWLGSANQREECSLQGRSYMWEEADEPSMYSQTCIGTKSASSKRGIFGSSLLITQNSSCATSQLLHSKPPLPALQQLPKSFYLCRFWGLSEQLGYGNLSCLTTVCRADPEQF